LNKIGTKNPGWNLVQSGSRVSSSSQFTWNYMFQMDIARIFRRWCGMYNTGIPL